MQAKLVTYLVIYEIHESIYSKKSPIKMCLNLDRLENKDVAAEYLVHTENHLNWLQEMGDTDMSPEKLWNKMKDVWHTAAVEVLGERKQVKSKPWISATSEKLTKQEKNARQRIDQQSYHKLKSELQRSLCTDKNKWLEQECKMINEYDSQEGCLTK